MAFQVAEIAHGTHGMDDWLMRFHGQEIRKQQRPNYYPDNNFINWHMREAFRALARYF